MGVLIIRETYYSEIYVGAHIFANPRVQGFGGAGCILKCPKLDPQAS